jgi:hypothetical protein
MGCYSFGQRKIVRKNIINIKICHSAIYDCQGNVQLYDALKFPRCLSGGGEDDTSGILVLHKLQIHFFLVRIYIRIAENNTVPVLMSRVFHSAADVPNKWILDVGNNQPKNFGLLCPKILCHQVWTVSQLLHCSHDLFSDSVTDMGLVCNHPGNRCRGNTRCRSHILAKEVDFFSIGSNDLTQYTLAIDRLHPDLCKEADAYHPALIKMIRMTVDAAKAEGKWVGVCGNAAANPNLATLLVGLGVDELSVSPANVFEEHKKSYILASSTDHPVS